MWWSSDWQRDVQLLGVDTAGKSSIWSASTTRCFNPCWVNRIMFLNFSIFAPKNLETSSWEFCELHHEFCAHDMGGRMEALKKESDHLLLGPSSGSFVTFETHWCRRNKTVSRPNTTQEEAFHTNQAKWTKPAIDLFLATYPPQVWTKYDRDHGAFAFWLCRR